MRYYAGLDVSLKETSVCILNETGTVLRELKVPSHPEDLIRILKDPALPLVRIGLEAGPLSQWLFSGMVEAGLSAICIATRRAKAFLKAQINKTDRNDARGIAQMMRVNLFRPVQVNADQPKAAGAADSPQTFAEKGYCDRERHAGDAAQFRTQSRRRQRRRLRGPHPRVDLRYVGLGQHHGAPAGSSEKAA